MNKNENFDDMKELFSKDITLPESLSKENIVQKIKDSSLVPQKKRNVKKFPKTAADSLKRSLLKRPLPRLKRRKGRLFCSPLSAAIQAARLDKCFQ